ncbi:unnamed protein product [Durusdinium trenchii]|uniref:Pentatricopeptide repeat-containing protein, chloroplastic n=1 Tax=Durusdinium trenchii TaxID=1381693 RepID=A0ABP0K298_9DINO
MEEHPFWWSFYFWSGPLSKSPSRQLFQSRIYVEVIHLSSVLSSLAQQWPRAMELLRCMEEDGMLLDTVCFNAALSACASCGQFEAALQLLEQMDASQVPKSYATASAAIVACGRRWPWALHFLASMPRNTFSYSAAISACEKAGNWSVMLLLLEDMLLERVPWNVVTCSACIAACEKGREWRRALQMLRQMRAAEVEPNTFSYNSAISACERGSQLTNALELLQEMDRVEIRQDVVTYGSAIFACEHGGQWHTALKLLEEMGGRHIEKNCVTCNAALSACGAARAWLAAVGIFQEMRSSAIGATVASFTALAAAAAGSWVTCLAVLEMARVAQASNCLAVAAVAAACERAWHLQEVNALLEELETSWLSAVRPNALRCGFQVARRPGLELIRTSYATMDGSDSSPIPLVLEALVQAEFRIVILEATNVPKERPDSIHLDDVDSSDNVSECTGRRCKSLAVSWKKGFWLGRRGVAVAAVADAGKSDAEVGRKVSGYPM